MAKSQKRLKRLPYVVVRTYSAGVHCGRLKSRNGQEVELVDARRLWSWEGANTLHEVASAGVAAGSRVSVVVPGVLLTQAIEVITCTDAGTSALESAQWAA